MGEYVGRIYDETRERPKYIIESRYGLEDAHDAPPVEERTLSAAGDEVHETPPGGSGAEPVYRAASRERQS